VADPDFVQPPAGNWMSLLDPAYLASRAKLIRARRESMKVAQPGTPAPSRPATPRCPPQPEYGTSHISIVDAQGNALAMTTTIEDVFGARQMVQGLPAEQRTDRLQLRTHRRDGKPIANRVQPGKRPRSSMAPTLVFDKASGSS
jgi:gamma-glutamyltranspeptidase/glutathione hydrolase